MIISQVSKILVASRHIGAVVARTGSISHGLSASRSSDLVAHRCVEAIDVAIGPEGIVSGESNQCARWVVGNGVVERGESEASILASGVISEHSRAWGEARVLAAVGEKDRDVIGGSVAKEAEG